MSEKVKEIRQYSKDVNREVITVTAGEGREVACYEFPAVDITPEDVLNALGLMVLDRHTPTDTRMRAAEIYFSYGRYKGDYYGLYTAPVDAIKMADKNQ